MLQLSHRLLLIAVERQVAVFLFLFLLLFLRLVARCVRVAIQDQNKLNAMIAKKHEPTVNKTER